MGYSILAMSFEASMNARAYQNASGKSWEVEHEEDEDVEYGDGSGGGYHFAVCEDDDGHDY
jgi:hypothetical protein